ncbi:hypothetical protein BDV41DRAFT_526621 [Aspergillus transmontanensis]|uniref:Uncharacterized protein n=1 Tax=Aspergillus transmontanensis TaxID=1034304 RepID=A0A5N6W8Q0_9EURO|nr:hypothetical protein BDV41DRAFT_526621 [Aspergillus transmontanensis]
MYQQRTHSPTRQQQILPIPGTDRHRIVHQPKPRPFQTHSPQPLPQRSAYKFSHHKQVYIKIASTIRRTPDRPTE